MALVEQLLETLTDDAPVGEVRVGSRCVAVRVGEGLGLAYYFRPCTDGDAATRPELPPGAAESSALELARLARSDHPLHAALGVAAINALVRPPAHELGQGNAFELIASRGANREVTVVGHFPFVERLRSRVGRLNVLELRPRDGDLPASEAPRVIPRSQVVAFTGATLVNHTMEGLLQLARGCPRVVVVGPTSVLSPVLFDHGVTDICGAQVTDPEAVLRDLSAGECLRHHPGIRKVLWTRGGPP